MIDRTAKSGDFFDHTAAEKTILVGSGEKNRLDLIEQSFVDVGHLQLHFKVRDSPQPSQQSTSTPNFGIGHRQPFKAVNFDVGQLLSGLTDLSHAVLNGK